jgi:hypothetical protein
MHFSDKLSYKILFIPSYGLKDMNFARCKYLQEFSGKKTEKLKLGRTLLASETTGRAGRKTAANNIWAKAHLTLDLKKKGAKR